MATASLFYATPATITFAPTTLASDTALIAGYQSAVVDNASNLYLDAQVGGKITTGTSPTAARQIEIYAFGSYDGTTFQAGAGGGAGTFSPTGEKTLMRRLEVIPTDNTSNHTYEWMCGSLAAAFDGQLPVEWGIYIVHNTGVALHATGGNHELKYTGIKTTSA